MTKFQAVREAGLVGTSREPHDAAKCWAFHANRSPKPQLLLAHALEETASRTPARRSPRRLECLCKRERDAKATVASPYCWFPGVVTSRSYGDAYKRRKRRSQSYSLRKSWASRSPSKCLDQSC